MKSDNYSLSILVAAFLSVSTAFGQTNTTGTNWAVTITAPDPNASETGDPGLFTVSRGTNAIGNVPVFLLISGTAGNGTDCVSITNRVLLAAGATSVSFSIDPIDDSSPEPTESVIVRVILPPTGFFPYSIGSPNTATVNIADNDGFVPSNQPPVVNILQPTNNAFFVAPTDILLQASAHDSDGTVASVEFFAHNQSLGFGSNISPDGTIGTNYFLAWNNVAAGEYELTAKATDDDGAMRISSARHILVGTNQPPATNQLPIVNLVRPTNNAVFPAMTNIALRAFALDFDGVVASVEFFANNQSLGFGTTTNLSGTASNFFLTWTNVPAGVYDLTAKATDDDGAMRISLPVHIFVGTNPPPPTNQLPFVNIIQPLNNAMFQAPANINIRASARDPDGVVTSVEFFANNQSIGFGSNINPDGTVTTNYFLTWNNVGAGSYDLTAKATDDDGALRISQPVRIIVATNQPPATNQAPFVDIVQPTNTAFFFAPANIPIRASVLDLDGFVVLVEFFANNQSIGFGRSTNFAGTVSGQFFLTWSNVPSGAYDLTAKATDDDGAMRFSSPVHILVGTNQPPPATNHPPLVRLLQPQDGARFAAPARIGIVAEAQDSDPFNFVFRVDFFANGVNIGQGVRNINSNGSVVSNQWSFSWSNVVAGEYNLTAQATDNFGGTGVSLPVHIFVGTNQPPPPTNQPPIVNIVQPTNNAFFAEGANIAVRAAAQDLDGFVALVEFFANDQSIGFGRRTNHFAGTVGNLFSLTWSNVATGAYNLTAKATDEDGAMRISPVVRIFVGTNQPPPNHPPQVRMLQPQDGARFAAPARIGLVAEAQDFDAFNFVHRVEFFANGANIGQGVRGTSGANNFQSNQWFFSWSNVLAGEFDLSARATDNFGASAHSLPVHVSVVATNHPPPPTNQLAVVNISATDPTASEGLVMWCSNTVMGVNWMFAANGVVQTNWPCPSGTNTATFTVRRSGSTNQSLRVYYSIGGSASNGVDYSALNGVVTIPAGARSAHIVVTPVNDHLPEGIETVVLHLIPSRDPQANVPYIIGQPAIAAAYITDNDRPPPPCRVLPDGTVHMCAPITNQCFRVELSTNLVNWAGVCTNRVADGAAHHLDPNPTNNVRQFFRFVPVPCPPEGQ